MPSRPRVVTERIIAPPKKDMPPLSELRDRALEQPPIAEAIESSDLAGAVINLVDYAESIEGLEDFTGLTNADQEAIAAAEIEGEAPHIPSRCLESAECEACMEPAFLGLEELRRSYARLALLYRKTRKVRDDAIALGDSVASIPKAGLGWGSAKQSILRKFESFEATYSRKHSEGIASLERLLREIGACEQKHLGGDGWYDTFGFLYVAFMRDRYALGP